MATQRPSATGPPSEDPLPVPMAVLVVGALGIGIGVFFGSLFTRGLAAFVAAAYALGEPRTGRRRARRGRRGARSARS